MFYKFVRLVIMLIINVLLILMQLYVGVMLIRLVIVLEYVFSREGLLCSVYLLKIQLRIVVVVVIIVFINVSVVILFVVFVDLVLKLN